MKSAIHIEFDENNVPMIRRLEGNLPKGTAEHVQELLGWIQREQEEMLQEGQGEQDPKGITDATQAGVQGEQGASQQANIQNSPHPTDAAAHATSPVQEQLSDPAESRAEREFRTSGDQPSDILAQSPPLIKQDAGMAGMPDKNPRPAGYVPPQMYGHPGHMRENVVPAAYNFKEGGQHIKPPGEGKPIMDTIKESMKEESKDNKITSADIEKLKNIKDSMRRAIARHDHRAIENLTHDYLELKERLLRVDVSDELQEQNAEQSPFSSNMDAGQGAAMGGPDSMMQEEASPTSPMPTSATPTPPMSPPNPAPALPNAAPPTPPISNTPALPTPSPSAPTPATPPMPSSAWGQEIAGGQEEPQRPSLEIEETPAPSATGSPSTTEGEAGGEAEKQQAEQALRDALKAGDIQKVQESVTQLENLHRSLGWFGVGALDENTLILSLYDLSDFSPFYGLDEEGIVKARAVGSSGGVKVSGASHTGQMGAPRAGAKYLRRWWDNGWKYEYASKKAEKHGVGKDAILAAANLQEHTIELPEIFLHPDEGGKTGEHGKIKDAYDAYKRTVKHESKVNPEKVTWVETDAAGQKHVFRQASNKEYEVQHHRVDGSVADPTSVEFDPKSSSLAGYMAHMRLNNMSEHHKDKDGNVMFSVLEVKSDKGSRWLIHEPDGSVDPAFNGSPPILTSKRSLENAVAFLTAVKELRKSGGKGRPFKGKVPASHLEGSKYGEDSLLRSLELGDIEYQLDEKGTDHNGRQITVLKPVLSEAQVKKVFQDPMVKATIGAALNRVKMRYGMTGQQLHGILQNLVDEASIHLYKCMTVERDPAMMGAFVRGFIPGKNHFLKMFTYSLAGPEGSKDGVLYRYLDSEYGSGAEFDEGSASSDYDEDKFEEMYGGGNMYSMSPEDWLMLQEEEGFKSLSKLLWPLDPAFLEVEHVLYEKIGGLAKSLEGDVDKELKEKSQAAYDKAFDWICARRTARVVVRALTKDLGKEKNEMTKSLKRAIFSHLGCLVSDTSLAKSQKELVCKKLVDIIQKSTEVSHEEAKNTLSSWYAQMKQHPVFKAGVMLQMGSDEGKQSFNLYKSLAMKDLESYFMDACEGESSIIE